MKRILGCILMFVCTEAYSASYSYNSNYKYEADLNLSRGAVHSYKVGSDSLTDIDARAAFHYTLQNHMQVGGEGGLVSITGVSGTKRETKTFLELMGVFTYNLSADHKDSFFGRVGAGLAPAADKYGQYDNKFSYFFDAGKRFAVWDHVAYKPLLRIAKYGDQDIEFLILALNVSLSF